MNTKLTDKQFEFCRVTASEIIKNLIDKKIDDSFNENDKSLFIISVLAVLLAGNSQLISDMCKVDAIDILNFIADFAAGLIQSSENETNKELN